MFRSEKYRISFSSVLLFPEDLTRCLMKYSAGCPAGAARYSLSQSCKSCTGTFLNCGNSWKHGTVWHGESSAQTTRWKTWRNALTLKRNGRTLESLWKARRFMHKPKNIKAAGFVACDLLLQKQLTLYNRLNHAHKSTESISFLCFYYIFYARINTT